MLSCGHLLSAQQLALQRHNVEALSSALPLGQGWCPMNWQILEGASRIPMPLFKATTALDTSPIYLQGTIELQ